ncbi:hypothetical protein E8E11_002044 [Didymella keratinophila]|nr:hypothetical protein E8E11_002044 [Didymella keratinophila]
MEALLERSLEEAPTKRKPASPQECPRDGNDKSIFTNASGTRAAQTQFYAACSTDPAFYADPSCQLLQLPYHTLLQINEYLDLDEARRALLGLPAPRAAQEIFIKEDSTKANLTPRATRNITTTKNKATSELDCESKPKRVRGPKRQDGPGRPRLYPRDENGKPIRHNLDGSRIAKKPRYNNIKRVLLSKGNCRKRRDSIDSDRED